MKKVVIPILFMLGCAISEGYAQKVALKSNLLYDATTTMNLGLEIGPSLGDTTRSSLLVL